MLGVGSFGDVASNVQSEAELLRMIADPVAAAQRLQELQGKVAEAQVILEQAKAENQKTLAARAEADEFSKATLAIVAGLDEREAKLAAREAWVEDAKGDIAARADSVAKAEEALVARKAEHDKEVAEADERIRALAANAAAHLRSAELVHASAEENARLKADLEANIAAAAAVRAEAEKKSNELQEAIDAARASQEHFEKRLAALKLAAEA